MGLIRDHIGETMGIERTIHGDNAFRIEHVCEHQGIWMLCLGIHTAREFVELTGFQLLLQ